MMAPFDKTLVILTLHIIIYKLDGHSLLLWAKPNELDSYNTIFTPTLWISSLEETEHYCGGW